MRWAPHCITLVPRYYETALQQLILMQSRPQLTRLARQHMVASDTGSLRKQHLPDGWADQVAEEAALLLAQEKYNYVVSRWVVLGCSCRGLASTAFAPASSKPFVRTAHHHRCGRGGGMQGVIAGLLHGSCVSSTARVCTAHAHSHGHTQ